MFVSFRILPFNFSKVITENVLKHTFCISTCYQDVTLLKATTLDLMKAIPQLPNNSVMPTLLPTAFQFFSLSFSREFEFRVFLDLQNFVLNTWMVICGSSIRQIASLPCTTGPALQSEQMRSFGLSFFKRLHSGLNFCTFLFFVFFCQQDAVKI